MLQLLSDKAIEVQPHAKIRDMRLESSSGLGLQYLHEFGEVGIKNFTVALYHALERFIVELTLDPGRLLRNAIVALLLFLCDNFAEEGFAHGSFSHAVQVFLNCASLLISSNFIFFVLR